MEIRSLNDTEKLAIRQALELYIRTYGKENSRCPAFSQRIILDEMLEKLLWRSKD